LALPHSFGVLVAKRLQHNDEYNAHRYERQALCGVTLSSPSIGRSDPLPRQRPTGEPGAVGYA
jgi:hypothetical protein